MWMYISVSNAHGQKCNDAESINVKQMQEKCVQWMLYNVLTVDLQLPAFLMSFVLCDACRDEDEGGDEESQKWSQFC